MVEMVQSSHSDTNVRPDSPENPIASRVHTITLDATRLPGRQQSINHTIENQSPQMIQQITTLQIPQQHDMETIRQSIEDFSLPSFTESEDLYDSDSDGDNTACHSLYVLHRSSSPDVPTTSIYGNP